MLANGCYFSVSKNDEPQNFSALRTEPRQETLLNNTMKGRHVYHNIQQKQFITITHFIFDTDNKKREKTKRIRPLPLVMTIVCMRKRFKRNG